MNLYSTTPSPQEQVDVLTKTAHARIERIVSYGQTSDWYDQEEDEWVSVLQGQGDITFVNGSVTTLRAGDTLFIPRHQTHRVSYTSSPCIWLCVFFSN